MGRSEFKYTTPPIRVGKIYRRINLLSECGFHTLNKMLNFYPLSYPRGLPDYKDSAYHNNRGRETHPCPVYDFEAARPPLSHRRMLKGGTDRLDKIRNATGGGCCLRYQFLAKPFKAHLTRRTVFGRQKIKFSCILVILQPRHHVFLWFPLKKGGSRARSGICNTGA